MLEGFEQVVLSNAFAPSASITRHGITFNKATVESFQRKQPDYVLLKINWNARQFALFIANKEDPGAIPFKTPNQKYPSVRWNNKELLRILSSLMSWNLNLCNGYRVPGIPLKEEKAVLFDLNAATPITKDM